MREIYKSEADSKGRKRFSPTHSPPLSSTFLRGHYCRLEPAMSLSFTPGPVKWFSRSTHVELPQTLPLVSRSPKVTEDLGSS